MTRSYRG